MIWYMLKAERVERARPSRCRRVGAANGRAKIFADLGLDELGQQRQGLLPPEIAGLDRDQARYPLLKTIVNSVPTDTFFSETVVCI
jgi:hypothetical protein